MVNKTEETKRRSRIRDLEITGIYKYSFLFNDCDHIVSYIAHGFLEVKSNLPQLPVHAA